jgi:DNA-binding LacI/PurR family transcriptional regulator
MVGTPKDTDAPAPEPPDPQCEVTMSSALSLPQVNQRDPTPKYLQAREILIDAIRSGRLAPGAKLPSTKEISSVFNISLITAHKALEGLVELGWLRREVGRGTFVRQDLDLASASQRPLAIGLHIDHQVNIDDYYHGTLINTLRRQARADTRRVEFFFHDHLDLRDKGSRDVGAILLHPPLEAQADVERLAQHYPLVVLGGAFPASPVACVDCDNASGTRAAVRHLLALGHRRLLVLSGPLCLSNSRDRAESAMAELAAHGVLLSERDRVVSQDSVLLDPDTEQRIVRRLLEHDRPTAVLAGGFYLALATMQAVRRSGLQIPTDVSVVGFDDPASAPLLDPPLTTVRQPLELMATQAYALLRQAVDSHTAILSSHKLPMELVVRQSTGPAAPRP